MILECWAERIDSKLHPILQLFDSNGRLLKVSRGYYGIDPLIDFRVPDNGDYIVRLHDLTYTGSTNHTYRLDIDTGPRVALAVPGVIRRGQSARVTLLGWNLANRTDAPYPALDRVDVEIPAESTNPDWPLPVQMTAAQAPFDAIAFQLPGSPCTGPDRYHRGSRRNGEQRQSLSSHRTTGQDSQRGRRPPGRCRRKGLVFLRGPPWRGGLYRVDRGTHGLPGAPGCLGP